MSGYPIIQPEVISPSTTKASQIEELYDKYEPIMYQLCVAMEALHSEYLQITGPIVLDIAALAADGRCVVMDEFVESLHWHSLELRQHAADLRNEFDHQRRAACNLAKLAR